MRRVTLLSPLFFFLAFQLLPARAQQSSAQISSTSVRRSGIQGAGSTQASGNAQTMNGSGVVTSTIVPVLVPAADKYEGKACIYADRRYSEGAVVRADGVTLVCAIREDAPGTVHAGPHELAWHVQASPESSGRSGRRATK